MKIKTILAASIMTAAFITANVATGSAQTKNPAPATTQTEQVQQDKCCMMDDLTADQKKQIDALKATWMKEKMGLQNQIAEKKAHLKTLMMLDEPVMADINKTIDETYALKAEMAKKHAAHVQAVRKILTPEQRLKFDMHHKDMDGEGCGKGQGMGHGKGCQQGGGQGMGCQQGGGQGMGCSQQKAGCQQGGGQGMGCSQQKAGCQQGGGQGMGCSQQKAGCQHQGAGMGQGTQHQGAACPSHQETK